MMLEGRIPGLTFMQNTGQVGAAPQVTNPGNINYSGKSRTGFG